MHPALSVIFFTVISGCGYGLLFLLALALLVHPELRGGEVVAMLAAGTLASATGLLSSMFHLGQPLRAWRAFSQWRSSWLSREGVAATLSFLPIGALLVAQWQHVDAAVVRALAAALATLAVITVYCTAQIYASLKTIAAWHNRFVLPGYLLLSLLNGAAWIWAIHLLFTQQQPLMVSRVAAPFIALLALASRELKRAYWRHLDTSPPISTSGSATGLGRFGAVRSAEAPHTEENYLTQEMGFRLARKHAARLRRISGILVGLAPAVLILLTLMLALLTPWVALAAAASVTAGTFVERWLFFAEAKHVVMLYYGARDPQPLRG